MKMNKLKVILCTLLVVILLGGCVNADFHVTINKDGSGEYEYKVLTNALVIEQLEPLKSKLEEQGYQIENIEEENQVGWMAKKEVSNIINEPPGQDLFEEINAQNPIEMQAASTPHIATGPPVTLISGLQSDDFTINPGLFTILFRLDTEADLTGMKKTGEKLGGQYGEALLRQMNLNFILTLPIKPDHHNATSVSEDGKTLTWKLVPGEVNPILIEAKLPNPLFWGAVVLIFFLFVLIILIVWFVRRKKRKQLA